METREVWRAGGCRERKPERVTIDRYQLDTHTHTHSVQSGWFSVSLYNYIEPLPKCLSIATSEPDNRHTHTHTQSCVQTSLQWKGAGRTGVRWEMVVKGTKKNSKKKGRDTGGKNGEKKAEGRRGRKRRGRNCSCKSCNWFDLIFKSGDLKLEVYHTLSSACYSSQ